MKDFFLQASEAIKAKQERDRNMPNATELVPDENYDRSQVSDLSGMFRMQKRLNNYAMLPYEDPDIGQKVLVAASAEIGEALQAIKGSWAWWGRGETDLEAAQEELTDIWFFVLAMLAVIEHNIVKISDDLPEVPGFTDKLGTIMEEEVLGKIPQYSRSMSDGIKGIENSEENQDADKLSITSKLLLELNSHFSGGMPGVEKTLGILIQLGALGHFIDLTPDVIYGKPLEQSYIKKAATNIQRWLDNGTVPIEYQRAAKEDLEVLRSGALPTASDDTFGDFGGSGNSAEA